jgi:predicted RNA-binding protein YlqC (UPF0109 family)
MTLFTNKGKEGSNMKQLVETIVKSIVDNEKRVQINEVEGGNSVIIEILVDKGDLGKVIGKSGKTASAIRSIIYAASFKTRKRYTVDINAHV